MLGKVWSYWEPHAEHLVASMLTHRSHQPRVLQGTRVSLFEGGFGLRCFQPLSPSA